MPVPHRPYVPTIGVLTVEKGEVGELQLDGVPRNPAFTHSLTS